MNQVTSIFANPGQAVTIVVQTTDGYTGARVDDFVPVVMEVLFPDRSVAEGFPQPMVRLNTGLYAYTLNIPTGPTSLGTFIASTYFVEPGTGLGVWQLFSIQVARPFGNSSASPI